MKKKDKKGKGKKKRSSDAATAGAAVAEGFPTGGESSGSSRRRRRRRSNSKRFLFKRGNMTLVRLLLLVNDAGPEGISTMNLFRQLGTTGYGQTTLSRAVKAGYIKRVQGESEHGQFPPVYNFITPTGIELLKSLVPR